MHIKTQPKTLAVSIKRSFINPLLLTSVVGMGALSAPSFAQQEDASAQKKDPVEVIEVQGVRRTIQDAISLKKESTSIVDGMTASDIGELPALSIGEALESLTGASSHTEQGGATEISIRGLGPFLGSTVFNGREAANGSGDRSVNFSQFPSELFSKIAIYKTQEASLIEGGVSGQIHLDTVKPLDFGKQRFQAEIKGNYNPATKDIVDPARDFGTRLTASYIDQFNSDKLGEIGISIGVQQDLKTNPEQEARSTSGWRDCANDPSRSGGVYASSNCDSGSGDLVMEIDPATGQAPDADVPFLFAPSSRSYRQNMTDDDREAVFAAIQWRPTNRLEINMDGQYSDRVFTEIRNDLVFAENRRINSPLVSPDDKLPGNLVVSESGAVQSFTNEQRIEIHSIFQERLEEYTGGGVSFAYDVSDVFKLSGDYSVSKTERRENIIQTRLQSEERDIYGNAVPGAENSGRVLTRTDIAQNGSEIPIFTVQNFDVNHHELFADSARTRADLNQFRNNKITAFRLDGEYLPDSESISMIKAGVRLSELEYDSVPRVRDEYTFDKSAIANASNTCKNDVFPESGFLSSVSGGQALITNVDSDGNVIAQGTGNTWATFDPLCLASTLLGSDIAIPAPEQTIASVDVQENTTAAYIQANYDTMLGEYPIRGNFGVRYVNTEVTSTSLRGDLVAVYNEVDDTLVDIVEEGELSPVSAVGEYTELLPSVNLVMELNDDVQLRAAVYKALSRPDPSDLGYGRDFAGLSESSDGVSLDDAVGLAIANGNPFTKPMTSVNYDVAVEWYPNADTVLALGAYIKKFKGGFENSSQIETFRVDNVDVDTVVTTQNVVDDTSTIKGIELTATHAFSYLDNEFFQNTGFKVSYNYADSDFEFEDAQFGASNFFDGEELIQRQGIVSPADIFGFSEHVLSSQLYYQKDGFSASINYKYRSEYFQQYISTPGNLRFIDDKEVYEFKASYRIDRNWKMSVSALNIFDDPKRQFNPTRDNFAEINVYGPRLFAGIQYRM